jgi:hypothetical protein
MDYLGIILGYLLQLKVTMQLLVLIVMIIATVLMLDQYMCSNEQVIVG